jgi:hypothetical protein
VPVIILAVAVGGTMLLTGLALKSQGLSEDLGLLDTAVRGGGALVGAGLVGAGVLGLEALRRRRDHRAWGATAGDFAWPPDGVQVAGTWRDAAKSAATVAAIALGGGSVPGLYFDLDQDVSLVLFFIGAPLAGWVAYLLCGGPLAQYRRYGPSRLKLPPGPLCPGGTAFAELEGGADLSRAELRLRCVRESMVGAGKQACFVRAELAEGRVAQRQATTTGLQFLLEVPADGPTTTLAGDPAVYWELFVSEEHAEFEAYFLVPVYPRPVPGA